MAFVSLDETGDRSFTFARKPGADMFLTRADVDAAGVKDADMVHAGSCSMSRDPAADATVYAMQVAKDNGKLVSFDVNYRNLMWKDDRDACSKAVQDILPIVDLLKISEEEEDMLGDTPAAVAKACNIGVVIETLGGDGAKAFWNGKEYFVPARKAKCVDTTGAGDAFWGGFTSCLLKNGVRKVEDITEELLLKAMNFGTVAGWLCVQKKGAMESLPTYAEVEAILEA